MNSETAIWTRLNPNKRLAKLGYVVTVTEVAVPEAELFSSFRESPVTESWLMYDEAYDAHAVEFGIVASFRHSYSRAYAGGGSRPCLRLAQIDLETATGGEPHGGFIIFRGEFGCCRTR
jgi:hypothetical protein